MKKLFASLLIGAALLLVVAGCSEDPAQAKPDTSSESGVLSSTEAAPEPVPASDEVTLWQNFAAEMERHGVTEGDLKTLENSGLPQTEIMEMTAQEILDRIEEIASVFTSNKMELVRELLSDWGLAANDEQFVYVGQHGTLRLEQVEDLIAAVERGDSASIMGVMIGNPMPVVFELVQEPGEGLTLWKHTDAYGTGEVESAQAAITTMDDCALFYQFTDADGVAFSFPKGSLQEVEAIENYIPGDDLPDAQVSAAQAVAAAEEIRPLHSGYDAWRAENNLPKSSSPYGTRIPESYIEQAQTLADDGQRAEIEGAAMIAGKPFYEVYFYQDEQFGGDAYYIGADDAGLIYNISMVDGMPIPVADKALRTIRCAGANEEAMDAASGAKTSLTLDDLFPTLPDTVTIEDNALYDTENSVAMADLTSVDEIKKPDDPFAHYDQLYAEAVQMEEGEWGGCPGRWFWLQKEITGGAVGGFENHIVYCIQTGENMLVITFHPVRGVGGVSAQREAFEAILNTMHG